MIIIVDSNGKPWPVSAVKFAGAIPVHDLGQGRILVGSATEAPHQRTTTREFVVTAATRVTGTVTKTRERSATRYFTHSRDRWQFNTEATRVTGTVTRTRERSATRYVTHSRDRWQCNTEASRQSGTATVSRVSCVTVLAVTWATVSVSRDLPERTVTREFTRERTVTA